MLADRKTRRQTDRHGYHNTPFPYLGRSGEVTMTGIRSARQITYAVTVTDVDGLATE